VAIKLGISEGVGRQRDARKVGSDAFDIVRLLQHYGPDAIANELISLADKDLIERLRRLAQRHLVDEVDKTASAVVRSSVQGVQAVPVEQIELLGRALVERLRASN
jgi:hypothetical protein